MLYIQESWQNKKIPERSSAAVLSVRVQNLEYWPLSSLAPLLLSAHRLPTRLKNFKTFSITCIFQSFKFEPWLFSHKMLSGERQGHCWEGLLLLPYCGDAFPLPSRLLGSSACALSPKITSLEKIIPFFFKIIIKRISAFALLSLSSLSFHNSSLCCVVDWL